jgi:hypothetical protein
MGGARMKAIIATLIAIGILYVVDSKFNDSRYTGVIQHAAISILPR